MPPAIIAAGIATAGAVGSAVIGNKGASNAAKATQQAADTSAQVIRDNYNQSAAALAPWQQSGLGANSQINALLGLSPSYQPQQQVQPNALAQFYGRGGMEDYSNIGGGFMNPGMAPSTPGYGGVMWQGQQPQGTVNTQPTYQQAFDNFRNSTGYQFRLGEGLRAINGGYAGGGTLQSGAAMKAINDYGQNMASAEFGNYLGALGNQQQLGFGAASAQAGVGQNTANSLASIYTNQGDNLANAALLKSQNTGNAINSLATIAGGIFGKKG